MINGGKVKEHVHQKRQIIKQIHWALQMLVEYSWCFSVKTLIEFFFLLFIFYLGGVLLSLFVAVLEFLWHARKNHANRRVNSFILNNDKVIFLVFFSIQFGGNY